MSSAITGKNWGVFLGVIYFLMIIHGIFIYSLSVVFDSASYIRTFGLTDADLSQSLLYKVTILRLWWRSPPAARSCF